MRLAGRAHDARTSRPIVVGAAAALLVAIACVWRDDPEPRAPRPAAEAVGFQFQHAARPIFQANGLAQWNGRIGATGYGRMWSLDPRRLEAEKVEVDGAAVVLALGATSTRLAALVRRTERAPATLLLAAVGDAALRWEEHALPTGRRDGDASEIALVGGEHGFFVSLDDRIYLLADGGWSELSPPTSRWDGDVDRRWHHGEPLLHERTRYAHRVATLVSTLGARATGLREDREPGNCGSFFAPVPDQDGTLWTAGEAEGGCLARFDGTQPMLSMRRTFADGHVYASAGRETWDLGLALAFGRLAFDDRGRPVVASERGVVRREASGAWTWLTPGWSTRDRVTDLLPIGDELIVVIGGSSLALLSPNERTARWFAEPADVQRPLEIAQRLSSPVPHGPALPIPIREPTLRDEGRADSSEGHGIR